MLIYMSVHIVNVFWLLSFLHPIVSAVVCRRGNEVVCCSGFAGYVWNEMVHNCTRCTIGFYGDRCALSCPFPRYGIKCAFHCNCSEEECHHQYGCRRSYGDCSLGAYGPYCESSCSYQGFGKWCQMTCGCDEHKCNPTTICLVEINTTILDENADSSSPARVPLTTTTKSNPLSTVNENSNELAAESNYCTGKGNGSIIKDNTENLRYTIIGLGFVCCAFLIFYIGLHIIFNKYIPKVKNRQGHGRQIVV